MKVVSLGNGRHGLILNSWSSKFGEYPAGDPELHHVAGSLYAEGTYSPTLLLDLHYTRTNHCAEGEAYDAERHLTLGTRDSPQYLARFEYDWYTEDEPSTAALYAARAVIPYLIVGNLRAANQAFLLFTSRLSSEKGGLGVQEISSKTSELRVYPPLPLLNFLGLLLLAVQRGSADLYRQLKKHYAAHLKEASSWNEALDQLGEMYFGIKIPRQGNPMLDGMMKMFMGAPASPKPKPKTVGQEAPAPAPALD